MLVGLTLLAAGTASAASTLDLPALKAMAANAAGVEAGCVAPAVAAPAEKAVPLTQKEAYSLKLPLVDVYDLNVINEDLVNFNLDIPLLRGESFDSTNAQAKSRWADIPLFRLLRVQIQGDEDAGNFDFIEAPLFSLFNGQVRGNDARSYSFIDSPLFTILHGAKDKEAKTSDFKFLELPLTTIVGSEKAPDAHHAQFLDLPFVSVFESEGDGDWGQTDVVDFTLGKLWETKRDTDFHSTEILKLPLNTRLFRHMRDGDDVSDTRFLTLPILGSAYRHSVDGDEEMTKVLFFFRFRNTRD